MTEDRVLLTGASGLLGRRLLHAAPDQIDIVALTHRQGVPGVPSVAADLRDRDAVLVAVADVQPTLVIHAAYANDLLSIVAATRHLAEAAEIVGAGFVFVSTDAVFLGDGRPRDEQAVPDATWDYGRWKAEAERIVLDASGLGVVVRLPLLVSVEPDDHVVRQLRSAATSGGPSRWFTDEMRRPALASDIAEAIWRIVALPVGARDGCWHLAGPERVSRWDIAQRMVHRLGLPPSSIQATVQPIPTDRPRDIAFTDARARRTIAWDPSHIR
jgi:dTDP-4-dehydrorhamnose reductase